MNTLSSHDASHRNAPPITTLEYHDVPRDLRGHGVQPETVSAGLDPEKKPPRVSLSEEELGQRLMQVAATAAQETEARLIHDHQRELQAERARISEAIVQFQGERTEYYSRVEPELVNLVLAVAGRVLHREAQVDRMLLAALAKIAVENLQQRSHVVVRVCPEACAEWREYFASHLSGTKVEVLEDSQLESSGCVLETELGTADVSIDAQLKEIERGFFDLLAKRPEPR